MESKTNYTIVGLAVLILLAGLLAAALWLSVGFEQKNYKIYAVYVHESVSGLSDESPVKFNGVRVGYVKSIELNHGDPQQVRILLNIEEGTPITASTYATLISQGITGNTFLGLSAASPELAPLEKTPGEPYPVIPSKPSLFKQLDRVLKEVAENVNEVSIQVKRIFDKENAENVKKSLANIEKITEAVAENSKNINQTLRELPGVVRDFKETARKFNEMATDVASAGVETAKTMKAGKNTIDKISQQTIPPIVGILQRFDTIAANLEKVSAEMRQNPAIILRGTAPPKPGPGERRQ